jgi:hypothetical protein
MSTPLKPTRTYAEKFANIEITAEQRREAHRNALEVLRGSKSATEILHEHPSGTPEWEPVCEPLPLPVCELLSKWTLTPEPIRTLNSEPIVWTQCQRVAMPPPAPAVPQQAEDVVEVYRAPKQPTSLPSLPPPITTLSFGGLFTGGRITDSWYDEQ